MAVEFPGGNVTAEGFDMLLDLADRGVIRILDVEFVVAGEDGVVSVVAPGDVKAGIDLSAWDGASSGLPPPRKRCAPSSTSWLSSGNSATPASSTMRSSPPRRPRY